MFQSIRLDLKTTIILASLVAFSCNLVQFAVQLNSNARSAFSPPWALAAGSSHNSTAPAPSPAKLAMTLAATPPGTTTVAPSAPLPAAAPDIAAKLRAAGLKDTYAGLYLAAQNATGTPWQILAAVHKIETGQSGDTNRTSYAGAEGPMQFLPSTFSRYAVDGDGNGTRSISSVSDSVFAAGRLLAANGAGRGQYTNAIYSYNHSYTYVGQVSDIYRRLGL